jgi:uncharacterized membrane protein
VGPLAIGFVSGLRTFTGPAVVSWAACYGWLNLQGTALAFMGSWAAVAIFSILALAEYVADKLPRTPNRTNAGPLIGRILLGGLSGAALAGAAQDSMTMGAVLGGVGAVIGAFAGYEIRRRLVRRLGVKDSFVAVPEDLVAIGLAYLTVA